MREIHGEVIRFCSHLVLKVGWVSDLTHNQACSHCLKEICYGWPIFILQRDLILPKFTASTYRGQYLPSGSYTTWEEFPPYLEKCISTLISFCSAQWIQIISAAFHPDDLFLFHSRFRRSPLASCQLSFGHIIDYHTMLAKSDLCL